MVTRISSPAEALGIPSFASHLEEVATQRPQLSYTADTAGCADSQPHLHMLRELIPSIGFAGKQVLSKGQKFLEESERSRAIKLMASCKNLQGPRTQL